MSSSPQQQNNEKALVRVSGTLAKFREKLIQALPKNRNVDQEISSVIATVAASMALQRCTPESIALAAYDAATLGLPVNKLGLAWLVPFGQEAKLQIGYRGYIHLVTESGYVLEVSAECVYENDRFRYTLGSHPSIDHEPPMKGSRGAFIAVYAIARLANGIIKQVVMSKEQVDHIRVKSRSSSNGPWVTDYDEMAKKTVIKRLCKCLPYNLPALGKVEIATSIEQEIYQHRPSTLLSSPNEVRQLAQPAMDSPLEGDYNESANPIIETEAELVTEVEPVQAQPINPLLGTLLDLQSELESINPNCDKLPKGVEGFQDSQLNIWCNKKRTCIKEAMAKQ